MWPEVTLTLQFEVILETSKDTQILLLLSENEVEATIAPDSLMTSIVPKDDEPPLWYVSTYTSTAVRLVTSKNGEVHDQEYAAALEVMPATR